MRLTRRGVGALVVAGVAVLLAASFGPRSLNAVAAPLLGAVGVGALLVWRADEPTLEVNPLAAGFPGETRTVTYTIEGGGVCRLAHDFGDGLAGDPVDAVVALPTTVETDVEYVRRGVYAVGLDRVRQRDPLGLVESAVDTDAAATAVVFPEVHRLTDRSALSALFADEALVERQEFDSLREYQPGDPLRHVHWKSSAKHDDFLVTEFSPSNRTETLVLAGQATSGCADDMATAVGTIALAALRAGLSVGLRLPDVSIAPGAGESHTANLLRVLARADHGQVSEADLEAADVAVSSQPRETVVRVGEGSLLFGDLVDPDPDDRPREVLAA